MKKNIYYRLHLIENHNEAYYLWKKHKFMNLPLVHFDAHLDITFDYQKNINIANFLYSAIKENIITELFWVIPGFKKDFNKDIFSIKNLLFKLKSQDPYTIMYNSKIKFDYGLIRTKLCGIPLYICTIDKLPFFNKPVLLDIDVDYFVIKRLKNSSPTQEIGKRKPWLNINNFTHVVKNNIKKIKFITMAYSVNGGYTPMKYKVIGDQLAHRLGFSNSNTEKRILAGKYFLTFRNYFEKGEMRDAKKFYDYALTLNPNYYILDNNYGPLYLKRGNYRTAKKEFTKMLKIDKRDTYSRIGLGIISLLRNDLENARQHFNKALRVNSKSNCLVYLAYIEFKLKNFKRAKIFISKFNKIHSKNFWGKLLLAKLYEKNNQHNLAKVEYQKTFNTGMQDTSPFGIDALLY